MVADAEGRTVNIAGTEVRRVRTMGGRTLYGRIGEAFPVGCLGCVGLAAGIAVRRRFRASRNRTCRVREGEAGQEASGGTAASYRWTTQRSSARMRRPSSNRTIAF